MTKTRAPLDAGCYQLIIEIESESTLAVGELGECVFARGLYVYTGSAMKNLRRRVARHQIPGKKAAPAHR